MQPQRANWDPEELERVHGGEWVREFQRFMLSFDHRPLEADNILGPETQWALDAQTQPLDRWYLWRTATKYLNLVEHPRGSNRDRDGVIDGWLGLCGIDVPAPWCAAAVCGVIREALSNRLGSRYQEWGPATASAVKLGRMFPRVTEPEFLDLAWFRTGSWEGHIGFVLGYDGAQAMVWEGNSDNRCRIVRREAQRLNFARLPLDVGGRMPSTVARAPFVETRTEGTR